MTPLEAIQRVKDSKGRDSHLLPDKTTRGPYLSDCMSWLWLSGGLTVNGALSLHSCTSLVSLPKGLTVKGYIDLEGCTSLESLPEGLTVNGDLYLFDCISLMSLPEGLTVGRDLYLQGCTSLLSIGNVTARKIFLPKDHKISDAEISVARFSGIEINLQ